MNKQEILALYEKEIRIGFEDPDLQREVFPHLVRLVREQPGMGFIRYSHLDKVYADSVIREQMAYFAEKNIPFEWDVFADDQPADLEERLKAFGFEPDLEPDDPGAMLALDLQGVSSALLNEISSDVRKVFDSSQLDDVVRIEQQVWGGNFAWLKPRLEKHLNIPDYLSIYVAYVNEEPACCAWMYYYPKSHFAILRGGSTVPDYREHGLYTAILAARVQEAIERGYRFLVVDASPMSRPILEKNGFQLLTYSRSYKKNNQAEVNKE